MFLSCWPLRTENETSCESSSRKGHHLGPAWRRTSVTVVRAFAHDMRNRGGAGSSGAQCDRLTGLPLPTTHLQRLLIRRQFHALRRRPNELAPNLTLIPRRQLRPLLTHRRNPARHGLRDPRLIAPRPASEPESGKQQQGERGEDADDDAGDCATGEAVAGFAVLRLG